MPVSAFLRQTAIHHYGALWLLAASLLVLGGCSEQTVPAKTKFTEQDKQQLQELQQQRVDEWGKPAK